MFNSPVCCAAAVSLSENRCTKLLLSTSAQVSHLRIFVDIVLEVIILCENRLGDDVIEFDRDRRKQWCFGRLCDPC